MIFNKHTTPVFWPNAPQNVRRVPRATRPRRTVTQPAVLAVVPALRTETDNRPPIFRDVVLSLPMAQRRNVAGLLGLVDLMPEPGAHRRAVAVAS